MPNFKYSGKNPGAIGGAYAATSINSRSDAQVIFQSDGSGFITLSESPGYVGFTWYTGGTLSGSTNITVNASNYVVSGVNTGSYSQSFSLDNSVPTNQIIVISMTAQANTQGVPGTSDYSYGQFEIIVNYNSGSVTYNIVLSAQSDFTG